MNSINNKKKINNLLFNQIWLPIFPEKNKSKQFYQIQNVIKLKKTNKKSLRKRLRYLNWYCCIKPTYFLYQYIQWNFIWKHIVQFQRKKTLLRLHQNYLRCFIFRWLNHYGFIWWQPGLVPGIVSNTLIAKRTILHYLIKRGHKHENPSYIKIPERIPKLFLLIQTHKNDIVFNEAKNKIYPVFGIDKPTTYTGVDFTINLCAITYKTFLETWFSQMDIINSPLGKQNLYKYKKNYNRYLFEKKWYYNVFFNKINFTKSNDIYLTEFNTKGVYSTLLFTPQTIQWLKYKTFFFLKNYYVYNLNNYLAWWFLNVSRPRYRYPKLYFKIWRKKFLQKKKRPVLYNTIIKNYRASNYDKINNLMFHQDEAMFFKKKNGSYNWNFFKKGLGIFQFYYLRRLLRRFKLWPSGTIGIKGGLIRRTSWAYRYTNLKKRIKRYPRFFIRGELFAIKKVLSYEMRLFFFSRELKRLWFFRWNNQKISKNISPYNAWIQKNNCKKTKSVQFGFWWRFSKLRITVLIKDHKNLYAYIFGKQLKFQRDTWKNLKKSYIEKKMTKKQRKNSKFFFISLAYFIQSGAVYPIRRLYRTWLKWERPLLWKKIDLLQYKMF